jgi:nicotinamide-nucleotide amidase
MTGGGLADRMSAVPGSSEYFVGGVVTYTRQMKIELLGVPPEFQPVSREMAEAMSINVRRKTGATYGISITGNAGPTADEGDAPVGLVFVGLADANGARVLERQFVADRPRIRAFTGQMALDLLRRHISQPL